jgi:hypothetical protein
LTEQEKDHVDNLTEQVLAFAAENIMQKDDLGSSLQDPTPLPTKDFIRHYFACEATGRPVSISQSQLDEVLVWIQMTGLTALPTTATLDTAVEDLAAKIKV